MKKILFRLFAFIVCIFILPALASQAYWQLSGNQASSWHRADWSSASILPQASQDREAAIYIMSAKTGRWKGGFSVHSWIVVKEEGAERYTRFDVVGWGTPVRINAYAPDARWYSNPPEIFKVIKGQEAARLIPKIINVVQNYPHSGRDDYILWPGPNSNSFIAHVLNEVPEIGVTLPANAVGRHYLSGGKYLHVDPDWMNIQLTYKGFAGFAFGKRSGIELHFLGLTAGIDFIKPAIKLPGFGTIGF